ncbi:prepilin-type N-terminal cleavage/methylation domain-containing protein [Clostridium perfringens]|uniref:prepilin-type N-terminal cleavage/methylation domain-containing protein n=1 Tax=Clostridium perfringens TaxID=1502 RepID=UPI0018AAF8C1|nr:prepilin-type N-terminal cleavage/methylation domain-containing protein [Clostridium perfringens]MDB2069666.1 prepilin-type N-terminal cleavage/methylation domain-containing protein [Clostridium perfringens]
MNTKKQNKKKKGFTLIELIVVIAIIAILAAIAIPNFISIQRDAKVKSDGASAKSIYDATSVLIAQNVITSKDGKFNYTLTLDGKQEDTKDTTGQKSANNEKEAATAIINYLAKQGDQKLTSQSIKDQPFVVTIQGQEDSPTIMVYVKTNDNKYKEFYPTIGTVKDSLNQ